MSTPASEPSASSAAVPVPSPVEKAAKFTEVGHEGLYVSAGYVQDEFLPALQGDRALKVYREMGDNDPVIGGIMFATLMLARQVDWSIEPYKDPAKDAKKAKAAAAAASATAAAGAPVTPGAALGPAVAKALALAVDNGDDTGPDDENANFVEDCFHDMANSWEDTLSQILTFIQYGWSMHEIVYKFRRGYKDDTEETSKYSDGKIGWKKLAGRAQETRFRWEVDEKGRILGMHQRVPQIGESFYIPMEKALLFRTQTNKNNPEGKSAFRNAYRPWFFKTRVEVIEAIGIERDLAGFPVMWVPFQMLSASATPEEKAALDGFKDIVRNIKRDEQEGLVMPLAYDDRGNKMYDISLLASSGKRQFDTDATISRYNQQIAMVILADFIMLGHEAVGSKALGASKIDLYMAALEAWLDAIADIFNTVAIPRLLRVNKMDPARAPKLVHTKIQSVDPAELGAAIQALATAGMPLFPDEALEAHLRQEIGLPPKSPDAHPAAMTPAPGDGPTGSGGPANPAEGAPAKDAAATPAPPPTSPPSPGAA